MKHTYLIESPINLLPSKTFNSIKDTISSNILITNRLQTYLDAGYVKIEPFVLEGNENQSVILFALESDKTSEKIYAIIFDSKKFITDILGPRIQILTQDNVNIGAYHGKSNQEIFTANIYNEKKSPEILQSLWLIPEYNCHVLFLLFLSITNQVK